LTTSGLITNYGFDVNFSKTFNPNYVSNMFFIKIDGVKTINFDDYKLMYSELEEKNINASDFRKWANLNNVYIPTSKTTFTLINRNKNQSNYFDSTGLLIIDVTQPAQVNTYATISDDNTTRRFTAGQRVGFNFIVDRVEDSEKSIERAIVPLIFSYVPSPNLFNSLNSLVSNPMGFIASYWFIFVIGLVVALIVSVVYRNFKGRGV